MNSIADDLAPRRSALIVFRPDESHLEGFLPAFGTPDGVYSRTCWLPILGPTSWVLWATVAHELDEMAPGVHCVEELTRALGLGRTQRLTKALQRLDRFGLASNPTTSHDDSWLLPTVSPPLWRKHHHLLDPHAREFHRRWSDGLDEANWHDPLHAATTVDPDDNGLEPTERTDP